MTYWHTLSRREKFLIIVATTLLIVVIFSLAVVRPVLAYHAKGVAAYAQAQETFGVTMRAVHMQTYRKAAREVAERSLRDVINAQALRDDIAYSALRVEQDGNVRVTLDENKAGAIFAWLKNLEDHHDIVVRQAQIRQRGRGGMVSASLLLGTQR